MFDFLSFLGNQGFSDWTSCRQCPMISTAVEAFLRCYVAGSEGVSGARALRAALSFGGRAILGQVIIFVALPAWLERYEDLLGYLVPVETGFANFESVG